MSTAANKLATITQLRRGSSKARYRILLVTEAAGGGVGRHLLDLAAGLIQRNHNVCLVYSPERADQSFRDGLARLDQLSTHELAMRRDVGPHDLGQVREIRKLIDSLGPFDILHAHSSKAGALLRLAADHTETPCVYTPHAFVTLDPDIGLLKRILYGRIERMLASRVNRIICVSEDEYAHARALGIPTELLTVVHNGIGEMPPASRAVVRSEFGIPPQALVVGTVARLTHQKATDRLLSAFAMGVSELAESRLVIVGDGPDREELNELAERLGLDQRIIFTGHADGTRLMAAFDIFALPSRYEAFPYVLLEAAARSLPIIMTATGGSGTVVRNGFNGYVVPQLNVEALSARLLELASDPLLRRRMGVNSSEVARHFTIRQMVEDTLEVYASCKGPSQDSGG